MNGLKHSVRSVIPHAVLMARRRWLLRRTAARFRNTSNADIFGSVYERHHWGVGADGGLSSGDGSHDPDIYGPYVAAVREFLESFDEPPAVVDLGCGDFNVGRQLLPFCGSLVACDVVPAVIERNSELFADDGVDFRVVDITSDNLPAGDVVVIRQVLQHLANADIARVLPKLRAYRHVVVTDHQPVGGFVPNLDIPSGPHIRVGIGSGLDLTQPPFDFSLGHARDLCVVPDDDSLLRTTVFSRN